MAARSLILATALLVTTLSARAFDAVSVTTEEPRAFGWSVGDVVTRSVTIDVPQRLVLDPESLTKHGRRGRAIELRNVEWTHSSIDGGERYRLRLDYQVFVSPREVRTLELPALVVRLSGRPRDEEARIEAWPLTVAPLVPVEVAARHGLGDLRPDVPPPLIDTAAARTRLALYAVVLAGILAYLAFVYLGVPWWSARQRPFAQAWRELRALGKPGSQEWRQRALQSVHQALNRTAGQVLFEPGVDRFIARHQRFARLRDDLVVFFRHSNDAFFASHPAEGDDRWLIGFCRRLRDAERGAA